MGRDRGTDWKSHHTEGANTLSISADIGTAAAPIEGGGGLVSPSQLRVSSDFTATGEQLSAQPWQRDTLHTSASSDCAVILLVLTLR